MLLFYYVCFGQTAALQREGRAPCEKSRGHVRLGRWCRTSVVPYGYYSSSGCRSLHCPMRTSTSLLSTVLSPERVEATFCSAGRTGRIGLLVMGRLRSLGCVMLIEIYVFFSRNWRAISMRPCHPVHCTRRAAKGLRDINGRLAAERRQTGKGGMHEEERACGPDSMATRT